MLGDEREVHRADQRQPVVGAVAEPGDLALRVCHRSFRKCVERARGAEARRHDPGLDVARADRSHHVVPAARTDDDILGEAPVLGVSGLQRAGRFGRWLQRREFAREVRCDKFHHIRRPLALGDVHEGGARGVAEFHAGVPGEPEIQIIVRQQNRRRPLPILRLVLPEPEDFRGCVAGEHRVSDPPDKFARPAKMPRDFHALGGCGCVAPELRRAHDVSALVERDEPVLLATDTDSPDLGSARAQRSEHLAHGGIRRGHPLRRILFHGAGGKVREETVGLVRGG